MQPHLLPLATVLVVGGSVRSRSSARAALVPSGYALSNAQTLFDAEQALLKHKPDLILLHLSLGDADPLAACAGWVAHTDIPVILRGTKRRKQDLIRGLHLGATDYVVQSLGPYELEARVGAVLRWRRQAAYRSIGTLALPYDEPLDPAPGRTTVTGYPLRLVVPPVPQMGVQTPSARRGADALASTPRRRVRVSRRGHLRVLNFS